MLRDWDFPFIHCTIDSDSGCLEVNVRIVYCAAFDCNANSNKNIVTCSRSKKATSSRRSTTSFAHFEKTCFDYDEDKRRWQPWVILMLESL